MLLVMSARQSSPVLPGSSRFLHLRTFTEHAKLAGSAAAGRVGPRCAATGQRLVSDHAVTRGAAGLARRRTTVTRHIDTPKQGQRQQHSKFSMVLC
jgi:hypothetical protein